MLRDRIVQALVFGVIAGTLGSGFAILIWSGFKSDDVLSFFGAFGGAAATVAGSVWLADRSIKREQREEQSSIHEELQILHQLAEAAYASYPTSGPWTDKWRNDRAALMDVSRSARRFFDEVVATAKTLSFQQRERVKRVHASLLRVIAFDDDVNSEGDLHPMDERTYASEIEPLKSDVSYCLSVFKRP